MFHHKGMSNQIMISGNTYHENSLEVSVGIKYKRKHRY